MDRGREEVDRDYRGRRRDKRMVEERTVQKVSKQHKVIHSSSCCKSWCWHLPYCSLLVIFFQPRVCIFVSTLLWDLIALFFS